VKERRANLHVACGVEIPPTGGVAPSPVVGGVNISFGANN